jgi:2-phosphosulfolactate phosphatase
MDEQAGFDSRLAWGVEGGHVLARVCPVLVVVDVIRFTTAVEVAVAHGAGVAPRPWPGRGARPDPGPYSLSPVSLLGIPPGTHLGLPSPNGATVSLAAAEAGAVVLAGCLRNASAVAVAAFLDAAPDLPVTLTACASGRELAARGHAADLPLAAEHDVSRVVPILVDGAFSGVDPASRPRPRGGG